MLPSSLVDLTLARINSSNLCNPRTVQRGSRYLQTAALKLKPSEQHVSNPRRYDGALRNKPKLQEGGLKVRQPSRDSNAISELSRRVQELEKVAEEHKAILDPPAYTEEQLMTIYEDLLSNPESAEPQVQEELEENVEENDLAAIIRLDERFMASVEETAPLPTESLSNMLRRMTVQHRPQKVKAEDLPAEPYRRVLTNIQRVLGDIRAMQGPESSSLSPGLLSISEWDSLLRTALRANDPRAAHLTLTLMQSTGLEATEERINTILSHFVHQGNPTDFEKFLKHYTQSPSPAQRHLHIKAHLNSTPLSTYPTSALTTLHTYENQNTPAPQKTYSKLIHRLLMAQNSTSQAQAWDLYAHMRYVAHPTPDVVIYTQMIRACASYYTASRPAEPERALDLWEEMTVEQGLEPTTGAWNAIILACARSGRKVYVAEAFRLAKQMLDSSRDAYGNPAFYPDVQTFCALLEGAKRVGDLARARWILAEMIGDKRGGGGVKPNEWVMVHVFHAYASYQVPFKRSMARIVEAEDEPSATTTEEEEDAQALPPIPQSSTPLFTHIPPQTHQEVTHEVDILFARILEETGTRINYASDALHAPIPTLKFDEVRIGVKLLNAYLAVHYKHSSLEKARDLWGRLWGELGVEKSARTYVEAIERCVNAKTDEREVALDWAHELMHEWTEGGLESTGYADARIKERMHIAYIKVLSLTHNLPLALTHLRHFVSLYPPSSIRSSSSSSSLTTKPPHRSTRISLQGTRPLVRLSGPAEVPDDSVPPFITFDDLELLHHRLVSAVGAGTGAGSGVGAGAGAGTGVGRERKEEGKRWEEEAIGYIKYVAKAYEWALRVRRDEGVRARARVVEEAREDEEDVD
ncbi:hypothetical protein V5O48_010771 [Marasmius crinis-equi]|uniref:Uncharacterized protein n=1 Tax=Marasmius crinis-equi TaxID=585013 RepID=A0ABR3F7H1_9AGAR